VIETITETQRETERDKDTNRQRETTRRTQCEREKLDTLRLRDDEEIVRRERDLRQKEKNMKKRKLFCLVIQWNHAT